MVEIARHAEFAVVDSQEYVLPILSLGVPVPDCQCLVEVRTAPTPGTGAPTLDFAVAWSSDRVAWATVSGETALTQHTGLAVSAKVDALKVAGIWLRLIPTIGGGTPTGGLVETTAGAAAVAAQGTLTLPTIPVGAKKSQGTLTLDTEPTGELEAAGTLSLPTIPTGAVKSAGTLTIDTQPIGEVSAQATLTMTSQPDDGDTITIDGRTYTWEDTLSDVDGNIFTGGTEAQAKLNLIAAIDLSGVAGTDYALSMTSHATVSAAAFIGDDAIFTVDLEGTAGNAVVSTETFNDPTSVWDAATFGTTVAGTDSDTYTIDARVYVLQNTLVDTDGNVQIGGNLAATQANIVAAKDLTGTPGTDYAASMTAHGSVDVAAFGGDDAILTAQVAGTAGDSIATTETFAEGTNVFDAATLGTTTAGVAGNTMTVDARVYVFVATAGDLEVGGDDEINIGANVAATQANIEGAFDDSGVSGTDYSDSITTHATVTIASFAANDAVLTAVTPGTAGNAIVTTETFTPGGDIFDAATLGTTVAGVNSDTMTIDGKVYKFQDTLTNVDGNINIGGSLANAKTNLVAALDLSGSAGSDYATLMTAHTSVDIAAFIADDAILSAQAPGTPGNSLATTETFAAGTNVFDAATLGTTVTGTVGDTMTVDARVYTFVNATADLEAGSTSQINIGANIAATQANIEGAFDDSGTSGTDYSDTITVHATVNIAAFAGNAAVLTAATAGTAGNSIVTTETFTPGDGVFDAATLGTTTSGAEAVGEVSTVDHGTASGGTWTMTVDGQTTGVMAWNISAAALKTALELLSTVSTLVSVTGTGVPTTDQWIVTHAAADGDQIVTIDDALLVEVHTYPSVTISVVA